MQSIKNLISAGKIETIFAPLLAMFPQSMNYLNKEQLLKSWKDIKSYLEKYHQTKTQGLTIDNWQSIIADINKIQLVSQLDQDPFKVLIRTILSARSKDNQTIKVSKHLFEYYDTPENLANAPEDHVREILKPIGFYNSKTKYIINTARHIVEKYDGKVPDTMDALMKLPGVGLKVAGCVMVYAFGKPEIPVDTHVHRIVNRWGLVKTKTPEKTMVELKKLLPKDWWTVVNDLLVRFGKTICKPIKPECSNCPLNQCCTSSNKNVKINKNQVNNDRQLNT
ncbi:MAG: endonuclease III domain-containing protein [Promethearchaeota archaeon]